MRGYYAILRLSPGASLEEVEQAHQDREEEWRRDRTVPRFQIQEAYRFLSDPENKSAYDAQRGPEAEPPSKTRTMILSGIMMFLFGIAGFVFPGFLLGVPESFNAGAVLVHSRGKNAGTRRTIWSGTTISSHHKVSSNRTSARATNIDLPPALTIFVALERRSDRA